jgi:NDP-sugar pyrophosphorylase family protein
MLPVAILMGGTATRLRPLTETIPKSLVEINGEPFLAHQLRLLRRRGVRRCVFCVGHLGEMIRNFAGDGAAFGLEVEYSFDGPALRGTAGAIHEALGLLGERFFVLYGDSYLTCDYGAVESAFEDSGKLGLMTVFPNLGSWDSSNVEFADGTIVAYDKVRRTSRMQYIDYGLGVFRHEAFERIDKGSVVDLAQIYQELLAKGALAAYQVNERFYEIGSLAGIADLSSALLSGI